MSSKSGGKTNKNVKKGTKRKKDANVRSGDENQNKVNVLSTSQDSNTSNNDQLRCEVVRDLKACYSTPIASNYIPPINLNGTVDGMSYALSPVGYQPPNPSVAQHAGFITQMDYGVKIDNLAQKIDQMFQKLNKLDQIESKINSFEKQVKAVTSDVSELKSTVVELEKSVKFASGKLDDYEKKNVEIQNKLQNVEKIEKSNEQLAEGLKSVKTQIEELNERHVDLQYRSMRDNLIFHGIAETEEENCEEALDEFIKDTLKIEDKIEFHRVHRMGRKSDGKSRPIVAKFVQFKEREAVRKSAFTKLNGEETKQYEINEQYPREINEKRKKLYPYYKAAKSQKKKAQLKYDKLYIDGELFVLPTEEGAEASASVASLPERTMNCSGLSAAAPVFTPRTRGGGRGARGRGGVRGRPGYRR